MSLFGIIPPNNLRFDQKQFISLLMKSVAMDVAQKKKIVAGISLQQRSIYHQMYLPGISMKQRFVLVRNYFILQVAFEVKKEKKNKRKSFPQF